MLNEIKSKKFYLENLQIQDCSLNFKRSKINSFLLKIHYCYDFIVYSTLINLCKKIILKDKTNKQKNKIQKHNFQNSNHFG